jgi:hypothetical protein
MALVLVGCGIPSGRKPSDDQPTDVVLKPEVVGVVTKWEYWDGVSGRYFLDTGDVIELGIGALEGHLPAQLVSASDIYYRSGNPRPGDPVQEPSVLLLVGHYPDDRVWYAAAPQAGEEMDWADRPCPFKIRGTGIFDEGSVLHFSTGLVLPKDRDFSLDFDMDGVEEFPLNAGDEVCIDRWGTALWAYIWWPR